MNKRPGIVLLISMLLLLLAATTAFSETLNELDLPGVASIPPGAPPPEIPQDCLIWLDADSPATGSLLQAEPLVTLFGTITCPLVEIFTSTGDPDAEDAGASGDGFDIVNAPVSAADMVFDFDVEAVEFIYGGNGGAILVEARDVNGVLVDSFFQPHTTDGEPAGPQTLSGSGIRSLHWQDPPYNYAVLDNVCVTPQFDPTPTEAGSWGGVKARYR